MAVQLFEGVQSVRQTARSLLAELIEQIYRTCRPSS